MKKEFLGFMATAAAAVLLSGCETTSSGDGMSTCGTEVDANGNPISSQCAEDFAAHVGEMGDRVHFAFDSSTLGDEARRKLEVQAAWLRANPTIEATVSGHCDIRGTREYNLALGERRAHAAKHYLTALGVTNKIGTISYGKERPFVAGDTAEAHAQNRAAVTTVGMACEDR